MKTVESVTLSDSAARRIETLSREEGKPVMLRVAVDGGGCSGFQYRFELVEAAESDDLVVRRGEASALVDPISLPLLEGSIVDFVDELVGAQFKVLNPKAKSSCGCGVSFSL